jgi:hypothetical protein
MMEVDSMPTAMLGKRGRCMKDDDVYDLRFNYMGYDDDNYSVKSARRSACDAYDAEQSLALRTAFTALYNLAKKTHCNGRFIEIDLNIPTHKGTASIEECSDMYDLDRITTDDSSDVNAYLSLSLSGDPSFFATFLANPQLYDILEMLRNKGINDVRVDPMAMTIEARLEPIV